MEFRKLCKVCDKPIKPEFLGEHEKCLDYAKIVRWEKMTSE